MKLERPNRGHRIIANAMAELEPGVYELIVDVERGQAVLKVEGGMFFRSADVSKRFTFIQKARSK